MQASQEVRQKLVMVIGNLVCRCIEEARKIPYILDQEQVVDLLVGNPAFFAELVRDEQHDRTEFSNDRLTAKLDAVAELGQFEALDAFDLSFSSPMDSDADLEPVMEQINKLTRTFVVYFGNMVTIFEKEFQLFMEKFRQSLQQAGMALRATELAPGDMQGLEKRAVACLRAGEFLQAFSFDRLLNSEVIAKELVSLPCSGYSLNRKLIKTAMEDERLCAGVLTFILRACYISQGNWQDLFATVIDLVGREPEVHRRTLLLERIERDGVFCCNLLCESFTNLKKWPPAERTAAIERSLERWKPRPAEA
ncbi:MAG: hypothetical protein LAP85_04005 [Acidobacteriia bacterium]|nr:hypothetical protein [Terriglobia bacterium]